MEHAEEVDDFSGGKNVSPGTVQTLQANFINKIQLESFNAYVLEKGSAGFYTRSWNFFIIKEL